MPKSQDQHPYKKVFVQVAGLSQLTAKELTEAINFQIGEPGRRESEYTVSTIQEYASPAGKQKPSDRLLDITRKIVIAQLNNDLTEAESVRINGETRAERSMRRLCEREIEEFRRLDEEQIDLEDAISAAA